MNQATIVDVIKPNIIYTATSNIHASYLYIKGYRNNLNINYFTKSLSFYWGESYYDPSQLVNGSHYIPYIGWYLNSKPGSQADLDQVCKDFDLQLDTPNKRIILPIGLTFDIKNNGSYKTSGLAIKGQKNMGSKIALKRFSATIPWNNLHHINLEYK